MTLIKLPKRVSTALVNSLASGVVPRVGLEHIEVGRKEEIAALLNDLENVREGAASFRFIIGRYGSGKSFMLQLLRNYAMERDFVVADVDLSPERRFSGSSGQGLATYRELMRNIATKTRPDGGALAAILEKWISGIQAQVVKETGLRPSDEQFGLQVEFRIMEIIHGMEGMVHGFDFATVLTAYWQGFRSGEDEMKANALKWLRGEFTTKTEAKSALRVGMIIDGDSWYDYIKLLARFVSSVGYKGLIVFIDEAVNLYKITQTVSRQNNYEKLLAIYNDTMQGKVVYMGILVGGTPQFLEDNRRGLYSYEALRSRLAESRFVKDGFRDFSGPVIRLETLTHNEIFVLLTRLMDVHAAHYRYEPFLKSDELRDFMQEVINRLGAEELLTPREVIRDFISILNILRQNPDTSFEKIIHGADFKATKPGEDPDQKDVGENFQEFSL
jgi:hypothetical protein